MLAGTSMFTLAHIENGRVTCTISLFMFMYWNMGLARSLVLILLTWFIKRVLNNSDFVNVPPTHSLESLHKMIAENGGTFSMNLNNSVTHCVAAESRGLSLSLSARTQRLTNIGFDSWKEIFAGIKYQAAKLHGDIVHCSWVLDCCSQKKLIPLQPKLVIYLLCCLFLIILKHICSLLFLFNELMALSLGFSVRMLILFLLKVLPLPIWFFQEEVTRRNWWICWYLLLGSRPCWHQTGILRGTSLFPYIFVELVFWMLFNLWLSCKNMERKRTLFNV